MLAVYIVARRRNYPKDKFPPLKEILISGMNALPALLSPIIIIGGMTTGFFTATEAAVVVSAYSLIIGVILGEIRLSNLGKIFYESLTQTVIVMFIVVMAAMFGWLLVYFRGSDQMVKLFTSISSNPKLILLMIIVLLLILGCFMESIAVILTVVPMLGPLSSKLGMDPIHFGVVVVLALMIGLLTPPVGMSVFTVSSITDLPPETIFRECTIYIIALTVLLIIVAYFPPITLFVPNLLWR
jgi:tripartite ATP-independent transporter DctM subunit